jgi:NAD(P)-dependent dehydrogenase (short-subunit alcohol dehydrogenase family)
VSEDAQRVAVITGGSRGIGAGLVDAYRRAGWAVVANALTIRPTTDADILAVKGDVAESSVSERIVKGALDRFGRIDTLVNNAGVYRSKPFTHYTEQDYAQMVAVNLTGFFRLTQRVVPVMLSQKGGHIVNITTTLADYASSEVPSVLVSMTKGGLASATRAWRSSSPTVESGSMPFRQGSSPRRRIGGRPMTSPCISNQSDGSVR